VLRPDTAGAAEKREMPAQSRCGATHPVALGWLPSTRGSPDLLFAALGSAGLKLQAMPLENKVGRGRDVIVGVLRHSSGLLEGDQYGVMAFSNTPSAVDNSCNRPRPSIEWPKAMMTVNVSRDLDAE